MSMPFQPDEIDDLEDKGTYLLSFCIRLGAAL